GALFRRGTKAKPLSAAALNNPSIRALADLTAQAERLNRSESQLLRNADTQVTTRIANVQGVMRRVGLNGNSFITRGMGGPYVSLSDVRISGIDDPAFTNAYVDAGAHGRQLGGLLTAL